jgi:hypothetical protein
VKPVEVDWVFDALPPSGARRGGDPAKHAFEASLRVFVREVVQNAVDQAMPGEPPDVHFRFQELQGAALERFFEVLQWRSLRAHLAAAASARGGTAIQKALAEIERRKRLLVLLIEDRDTVGLTGHEDEGDSHFRALCKDTLYSHKQSAAAGGSYGLGKSVLWGFSALSTVLFHSQLSEELPGQESPRLIGRTELPTHTLVGRKPGEASFAGSGWFGRKTAKAPYRAESLWAHPARETAEALGLQRHDAERTGTSILVLGFRDPAADAERTPAELAEGIRGAIEREFWPAIAMRRLSTWVAAGGGGLLSEREFKLARPFFDCYRRSCLGPAASERAHAGEAFGDLSNEALIDAGDVVYRDLEVEIPARRDDAMPATKGHVRLAVRLCGEHEGSELMGHVAMFRSPGMVVRYMDQRGLVKSSRPFHALVACGTARAPEAILDSDRAIERFLRAAEPPGHDRWDVTETLKNDYERGYKKALDQLSSKVIETLKLLLLDSPTQGKRGPERLRKKFPLGIKGSGGGGGARSAFRFSDVQARFEAGRWWFRGEVRPVSKLPSWACEIRLAEIGEDGGKVGEVAVESMTADAGSVEVVLGNALIRTEAPALQFEGTSALGPPASSGRRALTLEIHSRSEGARVGK